METVESIINNLVFEPVRMFKSCGDTIAVTNTKFKNIDIVERIFYPFNIFKEPTYTYSCDILLNKSSDTFGLIELESDRYYCDEGFGYPESEKLENIIEFILKQN